MIYIIRSGNVKFLSEDDELIQNNDKLFIEINFECINLKNSNRFMKIKIKHSI